MLRWCGWLKKIWPAPLCWQGPLKAISVFIWVLKQGSSDFRIAQPLWDRMEEGGLHLHDWRAEERFTGHRKSTSMICIANCPVYGVQQYLIALCAHTSRVGNANYIKPVTVSSRSYVKIFISTLKNKSVPHEDTATNICKFRHARRFQCKLHLCWQQHQTLFTTGQWIHSWAF